MSIVPDSPFSPFLSEQGYVVLDGGLATELERRGADLRDSLWSAKVLLENPALIYQVHLDYFAAGADVATTASYQASFAGLAQRGLDQDGAAEVMRRSVALACAARNDFWRNPNNRQARLRPLVAASVGPYGAVLANGAEYSGDYDLDLAGLVAFHAPRLAVLAASGADLLACETIPTLVEAEALLAALAAVCPEMPAWLSFSCGDGQRLRHGERLTDAVALVARSRQVVAVGVNCTAPRHVESLLRAARAAQADSVRAPLLAYPNSGEVWNPETGWHIGEVHGDFGAGVARWWAAGARLIGGCCRTTPDDVRDVRVSLARLAQTSRT